MFRVQCPPVLLSKKFLTLDVRCADTSIGQYFVHTGDVTRCVSFHSSNNNKMYFWHWRLLTLTKWIIEGNDSIPPHHCRRLHFSSSNFSLNNRKWYRLQISMTTHYQYLTFIPPICLNFTHSMARTSHMFV